MLETLLILGNFKHPFLCSVAFIFRVHKKMTESYLVRKKNDPRFEHCKEAWGFSCCKYTHYSTIICYLETFK